VRVFLWVAAVVVAAAFLPLLATVLGYQLAGTLWMKARLTSPLLSQAGDVAAGLIGGLVVGLLEKAILRLRVLPAVLAGAAVGLAHAIYPPSTVVALPIAAGLAAFRQQGEARWVRSQAIAAAWIALALLLPFPRWAQLALIVAAALCSGWGAATR
jgi:hypothetical protein